MRIFEVCVKKTSIAQQGYEITPAVADRYLRWLDWKGTGDSNSALDTMKVIEIREGNAPFCGMNAPDGFVVIRVSFDWSGALLFGGPSWRHPIIELSELELLASESRVDVQTP